MKFLGSKQEDVVVVWGDHAPGCEKCRQVDLNKSASFAHACASPGAALLTEELRKRQAPIETEKRKENERWTRERGTFKVDKGSKPNMRYVGD